MSKVKRVFLMLSAIVALTSVLVSAAGVHRAYLPLVLRQELPAPTATDTVTPTATPTATTPAPTATPTATATVAPPATITIVSHTTYKPQYSSYQHVCGEVRNDTGSNAYDVRVVATFYNSAGALVGSKTSSVRLDMLRPNEKGPFWILAEPASDWSRYEVAVASFKTQSYITYNHDFALFNTNSYRSGGYYYVVGQVRNDTSETWRYVEAMVTFYNSAGIAVGTDDAFVASTDLAPGATSSFSVDFYESGKPVTVASHAIVIEGWR